MRPGDQSASLDNQLKGGTVAPNFTPNNVRSVTICTSLFYPMGIFCLFPGSRAAVPTPGKVLQQSQTPVCKAPGMKIALESSLAIIIIYQALARCKDHPPVLQPSHSTTGQALPGIQMPAQK